MGLHRRVNLMTGKSKQILLHMYGHFAGNSEESAEL